MRSVLIVAALCSLAVFMGFGCGGEPSAPTGLDAVTSGNGAPAIVIWSGSENKGLEPIVSEYAQSKGVPILVRYHGSIDIMRELRKGHQAEPDILWPAAGHWLAIGDTAKVIRHAESIMKSPLVVAVRRSKAEALGWVPDRPNYIGRELTVEDVLKATSAGTLRLGMTSATQSNSGNQAYLGFLYAFAGKPEMLEMKHLQDPAVGAKVSKLLRSFNRSAGSSGFLKDLLVERSDALDGMVNYECLVIEANEVLVAQGKEPLFAVYVSDGTAIADSPLALVDKGDPRKEEFFKGLQNYLLSEPVQQRILQSGRRTGKVGLAVSGAVTKFNPAWGIDVSRTISPVPLPPNDVILEAMNLYQTAFRKPSLTVYVLDYSGSMSQNGGEQQLKDAMRILLNPQLAAEYLLQPSPRDVSICIPFSSHADSPITVSGNDPQLLANLFAQLDQKSAGGGTALYGAVGKAFQALQPYADRAGEYHISVIVMTDGAPTDYPSALEQAVRSSPLWGDVPIYSILFGEGVRRDLMEELSKKAFGKVFDGTKDLATAMREAKGFN